MHLFLSFSETTAKLNPHNFFLSLRRVMQTQWHSLQKQWLTYLCKLTKSNIVNINSKHDLQTEGKHSKWEENTHAHESKHNGENDYKSDNSGENKGECKSSKGTKWNIVLFKNERILVESYKGIYSKTF